MAKFTFAVLTNDPNRLNVISAKLGSRAGTANENKAGLGEYSDTEINKAVKLGTVSNFLLCAEGDEIDGIIDNIDAGGTEDGYTFGGVARPNGGQRFNALVGPNQATALAIGALVVADEQFAVGVENSAPPKGMRLNLRVKAGAPTLHKWRVMRVVSGTGAAGSVVVIEKI